MAKKQIDLGLTGLDELFMDDKERAESKLPKGVYFAIGVVVVICLILFLGWLMQRGESRAS